VSDKGTTNEGPLRMQFELSRDDDPSLYDDLIRFKKGTKRINRLRFLAHEGMVAQAAMQGMAAVRGGPPAKPDAELGESGEVGLGPQIPITAEVFDAGAIDE
jgi:hypothetical protein